METLKEFLVASNLCLLLGATGVLAYVRPATRRLSRWLLAGTTVLLATLSSGWTATALLSPLEHANRPAGARNVDPPAVAIVVLAAYADAEPALPLSSRPNASALFRVVEAVHLRERCRACPVYVTGNSPTVDVMAEVLASLGVPDREIVTDTGAEHTARSARNMAARLPAGPFYLVTSAGHMPRALLAFRQQGLAPLPAPTDFKRPRVASLDDALPSPRGLHHSDLAVREYLGLLWYHLNGGNY